MNAGIIYHCIYINVMGVSLWLVIDADTIDCNSIELCTSFPMCDFFLKEFEMLFMPDFSVRCFLLHYLGCDLEKRSGNLHDDLEKKQVSEIRFVLWSFILRKRKEKENTQTNWDCLF